MAPAALDEDVLKITTTRLPPGLALVGEIDESTYDTLVTALHGALDRAAHDDIHLDLSEVECCDAAGLHAMVRLTDRLERGQHVVLHEPPKPTIVFMGIVGWADLPQLIVQDR